jgi:hypothetical protein
VSPQTIGLSFLALLSYFLQSVLLVLLIMLSRDHVRIRLSVTATKCDQDPSRILIFARRD